MDNTTFSLEFLPKLSKDYILKYVSEIDIFAEFLGITTTDINNCLENGKLICSPLRTDNSPTCGFYYDKNYRLRFNDFAGYFHGDCFDVVAYQYNLDASNHQGFAICLDIVAKRFRLHKYAEVFLTSALPTRQNTIVTNIKITKNTIIEVQTRGWNNADIKYWSNANVKTQLLDKLNIVPVYAAWINQQQVYHFNYNDPCYGYYFGVKAEIQQWKLYFPNRTQYKFLTNSKRLQGLDLIKPAKIGIITKSMKDVAVLKSFGIEAVAVAGETIRPTKNEVLYLQAKWQTIYVLMDFDYTGIQMTQYLRRTYKFQPLFYTNGRFGTVNYGAKDTYDFINYWGTNTFNEMLDYFKSDGLERTFDYEWFIFQLLK